MLQETNKTEFTYNNINVTAYFSNKSKEYEVPLPEINNLLYLGMTRELVHRINRYRKEVQFNITDRIELKLQAESELLRAVIANCEYIMKNTLCRKLELEVLTK